MVRKRFYAIINGRDGFTGIVNSWQMGKLYTVGVSGAVHKGFAVLNDAENWLAARSSPPMSSQSQSPPPPSSPPASLPAPVEAPPPPSSSAGASSRIRFRSQSVSDELEPAPKRRLFSSHAPTAEDMDLGSDWGSVLDPMPLVASKGYANL